MDEKMLELFKPFDSKYTITSMNKPFALAGYLTLLSTGNQIASFYLHDKVQDPANDTVSSRLKYTKIS